MRVILWNCEFQRIIFASSNYKMIEKFLVILIILLIIIIYVLLFIKKPNVHSYEPYYSYADIRSRLRTGDIILFTCQNHNSILTQFSYYMRTSLVGSEYGHAGVIIRGVNNKLYIVECCGYDQCGHQKALYINGGKLGRGGVRIIGFDTVLKAYDDEYKGIFGVKFISDEIPYAKAINAISQYKEISFQQREVLCVLAFIDNVISHSLAKRIADKCDNKKMICTDFVYDFLYKCNVVEKFQSKLFWPHLITNEFFDSKQKIKYSKLYKFKLEN